MVCEYIRWHVSIALSRDPHPSFGRAISNMDGGNFLRTGDNPSQCDKALSWQFI